MRFRRRLEPKAQVNLVPMIDVVFQLVIFFMVSTTFVLTPGIPIAFPSSTTAENVAMTKMVITIVSDQEIFLNQTPYTMNGLDTVLAELAQKGEQEIKSIIVEGNKTVSYAAMINVIDILRKNGFKAANLRTIKEK